MFFTGILNQAIFSLMLIVNSRFVTSASLEAIHLVAVHPERPVTKVLWQSMLLLGGIERPRSCLASQITWVPPHMTVVGSQANAWFISLLPSMYGQLDVSWPNCSVENLFTKAESKSDYICVMKYYVHAPE